MHVFDKQNDKSVKNIHRRQGRNIPNPEYGKICSINRMNAKFRGEVQCDASDRREVKLPDGTKVLTTSLMVGEFDLLAAGLFSFREQWDFSFALNRDLPRTTDARYPETAHKYLLKTLVPVTWPIEPPFVSNPFVLLDRLVQDRQRKKS